MKYDSGMTQFHKDIIAALRYMLKDDSEITEKFSPKDGSPAPLRDYLKLNYGKPYSSHVGNGMRYSCNFSKGFELTFDTILNNPGDKNLTLSWSQTAKFIRDNWDEVFKKNKPKSRPLETLVKTFDEAEITCPNWLPGKTLTYLEAVNGIHFECKAFSMEFCKLDDITNFFVQHCHKPHECPYCKDSVEKQPSYIDKLREEYPKVTETDDWFYGTYCPAELFVGKNVKDYLCEECNYSDIDTEACQKCWRERCPKLYSRSNRSGIAHDGDRNEIPFYPWSSTSYGQPDGILGINCHHHKYPFADGVNFQRYFPYDQEENAERYKEFQKQRAMERRVRETSRQADMLEAAGDTEGAKAARRKLREQRRAYRDYSKEHGLAVHNDRLTVVKVRNGDTSYKNIYSSGLTDKGGSDIIKSGRDKMALEYQRYGRNKDTLVNKTYIDSGEYRRKFDNITDNPKVNKTLYDCAKAALKHRSGTEFEDMYWIDGDTGEIIKSALDEKEPRGVAYSDSINKAIRGRKNLVVMHTHPHSMPPSIADFNSAYSHNYSKAIILCHDGKIIQYNSTEKISSTLYDMYLQKFLSQGMTDYDAQIKSLEKLKENHSIDFWEVE